jgi:hypothetical protein
VDEKALWMTSPVPLPRIHTYESFSTPEALIGLFSSVQTVVPLEITGTGKRAIALGTSMYDRGCITTVFSD